MSGKIKIMILQTRHIESISYLTAELVKAFPRERYQVSLVYLESGEPTAIDALAYECVFLGLAKTDYKGLRLKAMKKVRPFLEANHFDVIIANMYKPVHLLMQLGRSVSAPVCVGVIHAFGEFDRFGRRWMMRLMLDDRWHMVGVSEPVRDYLIGARCGLNARNTSAINNAIDVQAVAAQALDAASARAALKLPAQGFLFGTVGRCVEGKRHLELVKAFHQFCGERRDVFLVIIGDGELRPALEAYIAAHRLQAQVFLTGYLPHAMKYMRALDCFVFPSESEGFGIALLEAMALELPAIVNRVEPLTSIVAGCGVAVDSSDTNALAVALENHYSLPLSARQAIGSAHYQRARDCYDIGQYRDTYRSLVEARLQRST
jgi:glycosyltransferase involved in cell wall biosynthesis